MAEFNSIEGLRNWFAGKALAASEATAENQGGGFAFTPDELAERAFAIADAMLVQASKETRASTQAAQLILDCARQARPKGRQRRVPAKKPGASGAAHA